MSVNGGEQRQRQVIAHAHGRLPPPSHAHGDNSPRWAQEPHYRPYSTHGAPVGADGAYHDVHRDPRDPQGGGQSMKGSHSAYASRDPSHTSYEGLDSSLAHHYTGPLPYTGTTDFLERRSDHVGLSRSYSDYSPSFGPATRGYLYGRGYYHGSPYTYRGQSGWHYRGRGVYYRGRGRGRGAYRGGPPVGSGSNYAGEEDPGMGRAYTPDREAFASASSPASATGTQGDVDLVRCMQDGSSRGAMPPRVTVDAQKDGSDSAAYARRAAAWGGLGKDDHAKWAPDDSGARQGPSVERQSADGDRRHSQETANDANGLREPASEGGADVLRVKLGGSQAAMVLSARDIGDVAHRDAEKVKAAASSAALPLADSESESAAPTPIQLVGEAEGDTCAYRSQATTSPIDLDSFTTLDSISRSGSSEASTHDARDKQLEADTPTPSSYASSRSVSEQSSPGLSPRSVLSSFLDHTRTTYNMTPTSLTSPYSSTPRGAPFGCMRGLALDQVREARLKILEARVVALAAQLDVVRLEIAELRMEEGSEVPLIDVD
ncbi:hypothetical protein C8Q73DRAFT_793617 [Cubamyces lactineus]|nr:hypothetical protein C8Q73DRAFT_793617 [Cubamyces lactineus]